MNRRRAECGTEAGYRRHLAFREVTCRRCCDAHAVEKANWRARAAGRDRDRAQPEHPVQYRAALAGREPADALTTADRCRLVAYLHGAGWTDLQIAYHTRMTLYTTARIRAALGLKPSQAATPREVA